MGCDYYTWIETIIMYRDASGNSCQYVDKPPFEQYDRRYRMGTGSYDPDFESPPNELDQAIRDYSTKLLFNDGEWLCNETGKARIVAICDKQKIPVGELVRVYKRMNGHWR